MSPEVVAFARREKVFLASVQGRTGEGDREKLELVAEDGARFTLPRGQILARFSPSGGPLEPARQAEWLRSLRRSAPRPPDWDDVHARLAEGATLAFEELASSVGAADEGARLALALGLGDSAPWLHRDGVAWRVVPRAKALARRSAADALRRAEEEDHALLAWWPQRGTTPPGGDVRGALDALSAFALRGEVPETERGRKLAGRIDLHEADPVLEALVLCGVLPPDTNPAPARSGLDRPFPDGALREAERIAAEPCDATGREDLTALLAVSVDDADTTEVDDALSLRRAADGSDDWDLLVHISDVAAAIPKGSALDRVAQARTSSLYLPESSIPMLPADLVARRLSLDRGEVRAAVTGVFRLRADGTLVSTRFVRSLVRVTRRLTYEETRDAAALAGSAEEGRALVELASGLRAARIRAGALVTSLPSLDVTVEDGVPRAEPRHQDTPGDLVVAECAVLFNCEAGGVLTRKDVAAFFRVQGPPRESEPAADDPLRPALLRRRFAATHLAVEAARHHGVGSDHYAQATSPMRRFADLVNQRQLCAALEDRAPEYLPAELESVAGPVSERERAVRRAADDRTDHWLARWIEPRQGTTVEGVLARPPRRGLGSVWVPELLRELPLRAPDGWKAPPAGTIASWRIDRVAPWRGRIELAP